MESWVEFLAADVTVAPTFLDMSDGSGSDTVQRRNRDNARAAYDAVQPYLPRLRPTQEEWPAPGGKLAALKRRLTSLGYDLGSLQSLKFFAINNERTYGGWRLTTARRPRRRACTRLHHSRTRSCRTASGQGRMNCSC